MAGGFRCARTGCGDAALSKPVFGKGTRYCLKHLRIMAMRRNSKTRGKAIPSTEAIESLIPPDMKCIGCARTMVWSKTESASRVMTLQHDRSGAFRLICQGCNTRHSRMPGDSFYELPDGHKRCAKCGETKPTSAFAADRSRPSGLKSHCRDCCRAHYVANSDYRRNRAKSKPERD